MLKKLDGIAREILKREYTEARFQIIAVKLKLSLESKKQSLNLFRQFFEQQIGSGHLRLGRSFHTF